MIKQSNNHNYSIFKRISSLILLILCVVIGVNLYYMHFENATKWYQVESEQLGRSLTLQAAKLIARPLANDDEETLNQYIAIVNQGLFVKGAVLFDDLGVRFDQKSEILSVVEMVKESANEPLVFVEDIVYEGNIIGYIKLLLDKRAVTEHHRVFNKNQFTQSLLIILLSLIAAGLTTRLFYKVRQSYKDAITQDRLT